MSTKRRWVVSASFIVVAAAVAAGCDTGSATPAQDACQGVTCSGHGQCAVIGGTTAACICGAGYQAAGLACVAQPADSGTESDGGTVNDGSSDDATVTDDGGAADVQVTDDEGIADAAGTDDGGVTADGGTTCSSGPAPASTPGSMACGDTQCLGDAGLPCCIGVPGDPPGHGQCRQPAQCYGVLKECEEAADCPANTLCCFKFIYSGSYAGTISTCQSQCEYGAYGQMCRTSAECGAGYDCQEWNANGIIVSMCTKPIGCP
jgi:hypothetical protein